MLKYVINKNKQNLNANICIFFFNVCFIILEWRLKFSSNIKYTARKTYRYLTYTHHPVFKLQLGALYRTSTKQTFHIPPLWPPQRQCFAMYFYMSTVPKSPIAPVQRLMPSNLWFFFGAAI